MNHERQTRQLLTGYLANKISADELDQLFQSLDTPEGKLLLREYLDREADNPENSNRELDPEMSDLLFQRLAGEITCKETPRSLPFFPKRWLWHAAAVFIGFLLIGIGYYSLKQHSNLTIATDAGQKRTVILPDGSRVTLNVNSTLTYNKDWTSGEARHVEMEGEAFFDVAHDTLHPFYVKTSRMEIKVLGTAFNVNSNQTKKIFETTLIRGKVTVRDLEKPQPKATILRPAQKAIFTADRSDAPKIEQVPADKSTTAYWSKGNLVFEDEPVGIILAELEKWYGVKFKISDQSKDCRFYLTIKNEPLAEILGLFEANPGIKPEINGKVITLNGSLCKKDNL